MNDRTMTHLILKQRGQDITEEDQVKVEESVGRERLTSHSHRGFSPVIETASRVEEPFQRFFLGKF